MFKPGRWRRSDNNRVKALFKLQFHVTQVPELNLEALSVSVVPGDVGKPTARLEKVIVREGTCRWEYPIYETMKFTSDAKTGKIDHRTYRFLVVSSGPAKSGYVGEVSMDFAVYALATKGSTVSLPLNNSKCDGFFHVSIQRLQETVELGIENTLTSNDELDNGIESHPNVDEQCINTELIREASSGSDMTMSSSGSSSGLNNIVQDHGTNTDDSSQSTLTGEGPEEASEIEVEKLRADIVVLSRQLDLSELELQTLRKQIMKESNKLQDLSKELACSKQERDALRAESEKYRSFQARMEEAKSKNKYQIESGDSRAILEEFRQELRYEKDVNSDLRMQLQKTNESNADLILAIQELEEMLESKGREATDSRSESDDEEQKALEEIVREHQDAKETYVLEQTIMDLRSEIEMYRRAKDEIEMQMEQLALDYEIVKQENHGMSIQLEQSRLQEQLKMQDECCSSSFTNVNELEAKIEGMELELEKQSEAYSESWATINELRARVKELEEEMGNQCNGFEADLEAVAQEKVVQEQRAVRAEEALRKTRWRNACTAEKLQEELKQLSVQMSSTFDANEKVAMNALVEASALRMQNSRFEDMLKKSDERLCSVKDNYEAKLLELSEQLNMQMQDEQLVGALSKQIRKLKAELDQLMVENKILSERVEQAENTRYELEFLKKSLKQSEAMIDSVNADKFELLNTITLLKKESEKYVNELNQMKSTKSQDDSTLDAFRSELEALKSQHDDLKTCLFENEAEKEKLKKQVFQLKGDLKKRDDAYTSIEKKLKESSKRTAPYDGLKSPLKNHKSVPVPHGSKGSTNLREKIKLLEAQIKSKEAALEASSNSFSAKEIDLRNKVAELESRMEELNRSSAEFSSHPEDQNTDGTGPESDARSETRGIDNIPSIASLPPNETQNAGRTNSNANVLEEELKTSSINNGDIRVDGAAEELESLRERTKTMAIELKEMQERYSEISLKFAEVEGERQQLVMTLRNLKNYKKR